MEPSAGLDILFACSGHRIGLPCSWFVLVTIIQTDESGVSVPSVRIQCRWSRMGSSLSIRIAVRVLSWGHPSGSKRRSGRGESACPDRGVRPVRAGLPCRQARAPARVSRRPRPRPPRRGASAPAVAARLPPTALPSALWPPGGRRLTSHQEAPPLPRLFALTVSPRGGGGPGGGSRCAVERGVAVGADRLPVAVLPPVSYPHRGRGTVCLRRRDA